MNDDTISRAAVLDFVSSMNACKEISDEAYVFQGIVVEYPSISAYPEYEGKPYFSIKYTKNGQEFIGYGTYNPEVLSEYLKEYFMPRWIPCKTALPKEDGQYIVTVKYEHVDGYEDIYSEHGEWVGGHWDAGFGHCGMVEKVLAWQPLPTSYREGGQE